MDDVVIVGGGPAGSVAAAQLAQRGVNAVLLDARQFPREKACGGGIQHRCLQFLPSDFSSVERAGCSSVRLSHGLVSTGVRDAGRPVVHCVTRWEFDHFLLEKAKSAGAHVREGVRVTSVERANGFIRLETSTGPLTARYVVAADGANSIVNQRLNPRCNFQWQTALYAEVDALKLGPSAARCNEMRVDVNSLPSGYAWIFPKGDRVNIGAGAPNRFARLLTKYLAAFLKSEGYETDDLRWRGHQLPTMTNRTVFASDSLFAVGDAAGMVEPLTGEGISYACHGAHLLSEAIAAHFNSAEPWAAESAYIKAVRSLIRSELIWSQRIVLFSTVFPRAFGAALRNDRMWGIFFRVLTGELTFKDLETNLLGWVRNMGPALEAFGYMRELVMRLSREVERAEHNLEALHASVTRKAVYAD